MRGRQRNESSPVHPGLPPSSTPCCSELSMPQSLTGLLMMGDQGPARLHVWPI